MNIKKLTKLLNNLGKSTTLNLGGNDIGKEGAKLIAEALKINTTLTTLNLGGNEIGKPGAKLIAEAL
jgi:Ran GTPase-activating protein (RanGAP) involved in mRNA processing and transport